MWCHVFCCPKGTTVVLDRTKTLSNLYMNQMPFYKWTVDYVLCLNVFNSILFILFICIFSDNTKGELQLMIVERNSRRRFVQAETGSRSRWLKVEEEEGKTMGCRFVWIFLLCLSFSHQRVTAQIEGNWWHFYTWFTHSQNLYVPFSLNCPLTHNLCVSVSYSK